ncbi:MAG: hypothetical protein DHS20C16_36950 [Phycisphaerae bacterium]|nr:MAG: hypothetical protein DHS20C16_36950 [Phycisphaerae bacterium]
MNASPTIDRKRLEQYPLLLDPVVTQVPIAITFMTIAFLFLRMSFIFAPLVEHLPSDYPELWTLKMLLGHPIWALFAGTAIGVVYVLVARGKRSKLDETAVNNYFIAKKDRRFNSKKYGVRKLIVVVLFLVLFWTGLLALCFLLNTSFHLIGLGFVVVICLSVLPRNCALRTEILRRRRIALAWEGVDPPNDRFSFRQKLMVGLHWASAVGFVAFAVFLVYEMEAGPFQEFDALGLHYAGSKLDADEANALERRLEEAPSDHAARLKLIGFYWKPYRDARKAKDVERAAAAMKRQLPHGQYFIEHLPGHVYTEIARTAMPFKVEDPDYPAIAELWHDQVKNNPGDADVLWNAAYFFRRVDDNQYQELLDQGRTLEPDEPRWTEALDELARRQDEPKT